MTFKGWPAEALEFFDGLAADNSKAYWQEHKAEYEAIVRGPMEALLVELEPKWGAGKIFRPYRDIRFSKDKSPYKTHIAARLEGAYVQVSAEGLAVGSGMWEMETDQVERYRAAVDGAKPGEKLRRVLDKAEASDLEVMSRSVLKSAPRGYPKDHPRVELLRYKGIALWREWPPAAWLGTAKAKGKVTEFLRLSAPLRDWLDENVGPTTLVPRRR